MKLLTFTSVAALLGACTTTTTPTPASVGTAQFNTAGTIVTVTQDGTNYALDFGNPNATVTLPGGQSVYKWKTGTAVPAGYVLAIPGIVMAAGLDNGTYFAGTSGTAYTGTLPMTGTANLSGVYASIVNGTSQEGALALTADFGAGTLASTSAGISVNGAISGTNIDGTMTVAGETGALSAGFYDLYGGYQVAGAVVGVNISGVFAAQ